MFLSGKNYGCYANFFSLLWLYLSNSQMRVYRTIGPLVVFGVKCHDFIMDQVLRKIVGIQNQLT